jgi:hypothetical protein
MRLVDGTTIVGSTLREIVCSVAGCTAVELYVQAIEASDSGAEIWFRCARHLLHPTFQPFVQAAGLPPTCEVEVGGTPCGALATHASLFGERVGATEHLGLVSNCVAHAVRAW